MDANTIGNKIKELRRARGMSQGNLADELGITSQAVSKWETGTSAPEITLLPDLAGIFGIAIDDLFDYSTEKRMEKICSMIEVGRVFSNTEFSQEESFLLHEVDTDPDNYAAISLLGDLYRHQANCMNKKSAHFARRALALRPNSKGDINNINNALCGKRYDWDVANHHELIDYWKQVLKTEPGNTRVYFYLLDNLIDDGRFAEAETVLCEARHKAPDALNDYYALFIRESRDGMHTVEAEYEALAEKYKEDWRVLFGLANSYSHHGDYEKALDLWQKVFDSMPHPRYTDALEAMAQICLLMGEPMRAAGYYEAELKLLREEWEIRFGAEVDTLKEKISACREHTEPQTKR